MLTSLAGDIGILIDVTGRRQILLKSEREPLLLLLTGPADLLNAGRVTFLIRGVDGATRAPAAFAAFNTCLASQRKTRAHTWTATTWNRRNALIALDGHAAGASLREIATATFGAKNTALSWRTTGKSLKFQVIRARERGEALINGGYRNLLKPRRAR